MSALLLSWSVLAAQVLLVAAMGCAALRLMRGPRAQEFISEVEGAPDVLSAQQVMARWTGNYKRGNERTARAHPRNRGR